VPTGFHHVTLNVTDLSRARAFYEGVLGLTVDQDFPGEKLRLRIGETDRLAEVLRRNGVAVDLHHDPMGPAIVTFRDPDNIQWELFEQT
jgi:glyoxylase I family protein